MTTLVVQAHPLEDSYNAVLRQRLVDVLEERRLPFECFRLAEGERPDLDDLVDATRLFVVYPTWSGGLPAQLLDWVHDVLGEPTALSAVTEVTAITTCGSSVFVNSVQGEWGKKYLKRSLVPHCSPGARFHWLPLYKIDRRSKQETTDHLDRIAKRIAAG